MDKKVEAAKKVALFVTDVDGVLTDGHMIIGNNGEEFKSFDTRDGMGISLLRRAGIKVAMVTKEKTSIVDARAKKLLVDDVFQGVGNKLDVLHSLSKKYGIPLDGIAYVGDDLNDIECMQAVGFPVCVKDASTFVKKYAKYITRKKGGEGAVREVIEYVLMAKGVLEKCIKEECGV